jgi:enamine deaminase RidA (YjgF/YER057c/UK114 family)
MERKWISSGVKVEETFGYARALRVGDWILVSGTVAAGPEGPVAPGNVEGQARFILGKIQKSIERLGGTIEDVVRTRVYLRNVDDWRGVAPAHAQMFGRIRPANVLVKAEVPGEFLVEIEADAVVGSGAASSELSPSARS